MDVNLWLKAATTVGIILLFKLLALPFAVACPSHIQCSNFTDSQKIEDCNYITSLGFSGDDEQEILCVLWDESYEYGTYQIPAYPPLDTDLTLDYSEIDTSSFILAFKIIMLLLFSYFVYCVLTKPSFVRKWFAV